MSDEQDNPEGGLVRLARPPAPKPSSDGQRDGTTVGVQPAAQLYQCDRCQDSGYYSIWTSNMFTPISSGFCWCEAGKQERARYEVKP